jgi:hypothetical protein
VKAKLPTNQKARSLKDQQIAKPIFCDAVQQQNYFFGIAKISRTSNGGTFSPELSVWEAS